MSILDQLEDGALKAFRDHGDDWLKKGIESVRKLVAANPDELHRKIGEEALDSIEKHQDRIAALGFSRATAFLGRVAVGENSQAARILLTYGGGRGGWGEADASVAAAGDAAEKARRDQDEALAIAKDVGISAAKAALPLLLAAVAGS